MDTTLRRRRQRKWPYLLLIVLLGFAVYTAFVLRWSYSDGERVGVLQKLSHKGFLCKTSEGELALYVVAGMSPQIWAFTVRDPQVARRLDSMLGERVRLHYTEHLGVPSSCFGDTSYYVDDATQVNALAPMAGAADAPSAHAPAPAPGPAPAAAPAPAPAPAVPAPPSR
jgi:hypothetical protein